MDLVHTDTLAQIHAPINTYSHTEKPLHTDIHTLIYTDTYTNTQTHAGTRLHNYALADNRSHADTLTATHSSSFQRSQWVQLSLPPGGTPARAGCSPGGQGWGPSPVVGVGSRQVKQHCPGPSHHSSRGQSSSGHGVKEHSTSPFWKKAKGHEPVRAAPKPRAI